MDSPEETRQAVTRLLTVDEPVTFLDVKRVLMRLERRIGTDDRPLDPLVTLLDAPHLSLGARYLLEDFLRRCATEHQRQRDRAQRPLTARDHQRPVRASAGSVLALVLGPMPSGHDFRLAATGPLILRPVGRPDSGTQACEVHLLRAGTGQILFQPAPGVRAVSESVKIPVIIEAPEC